MACWQTVIDVKSLSTLGNFLASKQRTRLTPKMTSMKNSHGAGDDDMKLCPKCKKGRLRLVALVVRRPQLDLSPSTFDTLLTSPMCSRTLVSNRSSSSGRRVSTPANLTDSRMSMTRQWVMSVLTRDPRRVRDYKHRSFLGNHRSLRLLRMKQSP